MAKYHQGKFKPKNPSKYIGDPTNIIYRSGWELKVFMTLDNHPAVTRWGSEEIIIPYKSPIDGKWHRYFPDIYIEVTNPDGKKAVQIVEIKPAAQTQSPAISKKLTPSGKVSKRYLTEVMTFGVNEAKWKAANEYCADRGWSFKVMTEKDIFGK